MAEIRPSVCSMTSAMPVRRLSPPPYGSSTGLVANRRAWDWISSLSAYETPPASTGNQAVMVPATNMFCSAPADAGSTRTVPLTVGTTPSASSTVGVTRSAVWAAYRPSGSLTSTTAVTSRSAGE